MGSIIFFSFFGLVILAGAIYFSIEEGDSNPGPWFLAIILCAVAICNIVNAVYEKNHEDEYLHDYTNQSIMLQEQINYADLLYHGNSDILRQLYEDAIEFNDKVETHRSKIGSWWSGAQHRAYWLDVPLVEFSVNEEFSIVGNASGEAVN